MKLQKPAAPSVRGMISRYSPPMSRPGTERANQTWSSRIEKSMIDVASPRGSRRSRAMKAVAMGAPPMVEGVMFEKKSQASWPRRPPLNPSRPCET